MRVSMFVLNGCARDARVLKEAKTLAHAGHDVQILALAGEGLDRSEERDGFRILRVDVLLPGEQLTLAKAGTTARPGNRAGALRRGPVSGLFSRPLAFIYDWARRRPSGRLRGFLGVLYRPYSLLQYSRQARLALRNAPSDVYHCHDLTTLPVGHMARRSTGGKLVYDSHELFTEVHYVTRIERAFLRPLERHLIRHADAVITVNGFVAGVLAKRYRINLPTVVRNCPPLATQGRDSSRGSLRESLSLDEAVPIIVHVGIFSRARGSQKLIEATAFLDRGVVVFLGWGPEEADMKEVVRQQGLQDRVLFVPPVPPEQVVGYIRSAQLGIIPALNVSLNHYYATPNKLWECIGAGLPVVSSNFPALKEIVEGYGLGCTFDPEYPRDIANAINYVLSDKDRYEQMKRNALQAAMVFNWETESRKLLKLYESLGQ